MCWLLALLLILGLTVAWLESRHRLRPTSPLRIKACDWQVSRTVDGLRASGFLEISNPHQRMEVMVPELRIEPVLIGRDDLSPIKIETRITPDHPDEEARQDGYWTAYIVKGRKQTRVNVVITLTGLDQQDPAQDHAQLADTIWIDVSWVNYGPFGRLHRRDGFLVPLQRPAPLQAGDAVFQRVGDCQVLPLKTHLLGPLDDTVEVLRHYGAHLVRPGDVLTIGETPVAVIQGRYHHPSMVEPGWLSRLLCRGFHPTSSLATACGLQSLIDLVGPTRVALAWILGFSMKLIGIKGGFYRLAGDQARLIDDITGTTPPYDQTIVLGPQDPEELCEQAANALGVAVAIVDVNDLGRVKVLASSRGCDQALLARALKPNPAGNANQRTPLVLVRPD